MLVQSQRGEALDAGRKLFFILRIEDGPKLYIRLVTEGEWQVKNGTPGTDSGVSGVHGVALEARETAPVPCGDAEIAFPEVLH